MLDDAAIRMALSNWCAPCCTCSENLSWSLRCIAAGSNQLPVVTRGAETKERLGNRPKKLEKDKRATWRGTDLDTGPSNPPNGEKKAISHM